MATTILAVPDDNLAEVCDIIEAGMNSLEAVYGEDTSVRLHEWVEQNRRYIARRDAT